MNNPFRKIIQQYFYFSKNDRNAILIICILILLSFIAIIIVNNIRSKSKYNYSEYEKLFETWETDKLESEINGKFLFDFNPNEITKEKLDSLLIPEQVKQNILKYRKAGGKFSSAAQLRKIYGMNDSIFDVVEKYIKIQKPEVVIYEKSDPVKIPVTGFFDPNNTDYQTLLSFGFSKYQASNLIKYIDNGGVLYAKKDLMKIYGIDSSFFKSIEKHIQIKSIEKSLSVNPEPDFTVELNNADSTDLIKLNGIGAVFANRILKYRNLLGGFYSKHQLLEVYNFPVEIFPRIEGQIMVDTLLIKKIRINFAEYRELLRHPYLNKKQVEAILEYRENNGTFKNAQQFQSVPLIDSLTFTHVRPYITYR